MALFEVETPNGTFEVEAPNEAALQGVIGKLSGAGAPAPAGDGPAPFSDRFGSGPMARDVQAQSGNYAGAVPIDDPNGPAALGRELTRRADVQLVGEPSLGNRAAAAVLSGGRTVGVGLPTNVGAGLATAAGALGVPGYSPRSFAENFQRAKDQEAALARQSPGARDLGVAAGVVGSLALPVAGAGAATLAGRAVGAGATGAGYTALGTLADEGVHRIGDSDTLARMAKGAAIGGAIGIGAQPVLEAGARQAGRFADWLTAPRLPAPPAVPENLFPKGVNPAAATEAQAAEFGIPLTRGEATGSFAQQQAEALMARGGGDTPHGRAVRDFMEQQGEAITAAKGTIGEKLAGGQSLVERPYDAAAQVAERARSTHQLAETVAQGREAAAAAENARLQPRDPVDVAGGTAQVLREQAAAQRARFRQSYEQAGQVPGAFERGAFQNVGESVVNRINNSERPIPIDPVLTPSANRAVADLQQMPHIADPERIGPSMGDVEQFRKRLVAYRGATTANPTDRAAMDQVIHHYDNHVEDALSNGLFNGDDRALDLYKQARAQFRSYRQTFHPQGPGDDVGRTMQLIVDRNAQPQEVANLLYGTGVAGNTSKALRLADRLQKVLPEPLWQQTQQGYIGRVVGSGGDHAKVVENIQKALSGEGRGLTYRILSDKQVSGLRSIQNGLQAARGAREAVPDWIQKLGKADFEPQAVAQNLFGKSTLTGTTASIGYAKGIRDLVGPTSDTWSAVRQAGWQQLVSKPEGATADFGPQALANRIVNFLEKDGRGLANMMYSAEERDTMRRFAGVMRTLTPQRIAGGSASPNSDTAPALLSAVQSLKKHQGKLSVMLGGLGFATGGLGGAGLGYTAASGLEKVASHLQAREAMKQAQKAVSGAPAVVMPPAPAPATADLPPWLTELLSRASVTGSRSAAQPSR